MADIEVPEGFRSIGMAQAMMEYAIPLREYVGNEMEGLNQAMQIGISIWNYALSLEKKLEGGSSEEEIVRQIHQVLNLSSQEAVDLFERMVERKNHLFPPEVQPDNPMVMYIRKEGSYLIAPFNWDNLDRDLRIGPLIVSDINI